MLIRHIQLNDAEQLLRLRLQLDEETQFMLFEPGERSIDLKEQQRQIEQVLLSEIYHRLLTSNAVSCTKRDIQR